MPTYSKRQTTLCQRNKASSMQWAMLLHIMTASCRSSSLWGEREGSQWKGVKLRAERHWREAEMATGPVGPKPLLPMGGPLCGLKKAYPPSQLSPATPPTPDLMASRCWAPIRGH